MKPKQRGSIGGGVLFTGHFPPCSLLPFSNVTISEAPSRRLRLLEKHSFKCKDQEETFGTRHGQTRPPFLPLTGHRPGSGLHSSSLVLIASSAKLRLPVLIPEASGAIQASPCFNIQPEGGKPPFVRHFEADKPEASEQCDLRHTAWQMT